MKFKFTYYIDSKIIRFKPFGLFLLFMFQVFIVHAQIDNKNRSISIPAVVNPKDTTDSRSILPSKPLENKNQLGGLSNPKTTPELNLPKKEFSMLGGEVFGNPGELYQKQIDKNIADTKLTPKEVEERNGSTTDQYFGDFKSKSEFINVVYRDFGVVDGDYIQVRVNDDVIKSQVFLTGGFTGFKLNLKPGLNKIDFVALNQGESGPNTAEFQVVDDKGNLISSNQWNLATGVKATIIVVKE